MGMRRSQHDGMHHSRERIVIEVRRVPRYETLVFTAFGSIANLPAGHWWLSLSRFHVAPWLMSRTSKTLLSQGLDAMMCSPLIPKESNRQRGMVPRSGSEAVPPAGLLRRQAIARRAP